MILITKIVLKIGDTQIQTDSTHLEIEEDIVSASIDYKKKYETGVEVAQVLDEVKVEDAGRLLRSFSSKFSWIYSDM